MTITKSFPFLFVLGDCVRAAEINYHNLGGLWRLNFLCGSGGYK